MGSRHHRARGHASLRALGLCLGPSLLYFAARAPFAGVANAGAAMAGAFLTPIALLLVPFALLASALDPNPRLCAVLGMLILVHSVVFGELYMSWGASRA